MSPLSLLGYGLALAGGVLAVGLASIVIGVLWFSIVGWAKGDRT